MGSREEIFYFYEYYLYLGGNICLRLSFSTFLFLLSAATIGLINAVVVAAVSAGFILAVEEVFERCSYD